jgi:biotin synthase-related radical SAM superfamily protein
MVLIDFRESNVQFIDINIDRRSRKLMRRIRRRTDSVVSDKDIIMYRKQVHTILTLGKRVGTVIETWVT